MTVSRNAVMAVITLLLILIVLITTQLVQTSRLTAQKEAHRRAENNAYQQEFGQSQVGPGSKL